MNEPEGLYDTRPPVAVETLHIERAYVLGMIQSAGDEWHEITDAKSVREAPRAELRLKEKILRLEKVLAILNEQIGALS